MEAETCEVKQKINMTSLPPTAYDEREQKGNPCLCIAKKKGKFGIITGDGNPFLPFEYDNITMAGFSLYLLIQHGKMGLLHTKRPTFQEGQPFEILKLIPCEYDLITFPRDGSSFVFLRKDTQMSSTLQIYFKSSQKVSTPFWREEYCDLNYVVVSDGKFGTQRIFDECGNCIFSTSGEKKNIICGAYETCAGTMFPEIVKGHIVGLILAEKKKTDQYRNFPVNSDFRYELTGVVKEFSFEHDEFIRPVLADNYIRTFERPFVTCFIVQKEGRYHILDGRCEPISNDEFKELTFDTRLLGITDKEYHIDVVLKKAKVDIDPFKDF